MDTPIVNRQAVMGSAVALAALLLHLSARTVPAADAVWVGDNDTLSTSPSGTRVGIGTDAPEQKLHVLNGHIRVSHSSAAPALKLYDDTNGKYFQWEFNRAGEKIRLVSTTTSNIILADLDGNVGIGLWSPSEKLEVDGDIDVDTVEAIYVKVEGGRRM